MAGSIVLAGVLLKLGGVGVWRLLWGVIFIIPLNIILCISIVGAAIAAVVTNIAVDLKVIVAYSSVVHMGLVIPGMFTILNVGFEGAIIVMIAHGICSSGLFASVNSFYLRSKTRRILINVGTNIILRGNIFIIVLLLLFNFSTPPSISLMGEMLLIMGVIFIIPLNIILCISIVLVCILYNLYIFSFIFHGKFNYIKPSSTYRIKEGSVL